MNRGNLGSLRPEPVLGGPVGANSMLLRDHFAGLALAALINHPDKDHMNRGKQAVPRLAKFAYEYADAMLAAREA